MKKFLLFCCAALCSFAGFSQTTYTWNGSGSANWATPGNWSPSGIPSSTDNVIIVTGANPCRLAGDVTVNNLTLTSGVLDLFGNTLTVNGANSVYTTGTVQPGKLIISAANSVTFGNGPLLFNCKVDITSATISVKNARFQDSTKLTKTGSSHDGNQGNNIYNGPLELTNAGSGAWVLGTNVPDQFNASSVFNNTGTDNLYVAYGSAGSHVFNGPASFNNAPSGTGVIYVAHNSLSTVFNGDVTVSSTSGNGVYFCNGSTLATATLSNGYALKIGAAGFTSGTLFLRQFQQVGSTAQNLTLTGNSTLRLGPSLVINGDFTSVSPALLLNGGTYNGTSSFRKSGPTGDWSNGGNIYNGVCSITNSGESYLVMGNNLPDIWNNDVTFTENGADRLLPAWRTAGNQFNGNIYVNSTDTAKGIQFCGGDTAARAILAAGKTIYSGASGITSGYLYLKQFIHQGTEPMNITTTGNSSVYLGPGSDFSAPVSVTSPNIYCQGAIYHAPASFTKTAGTNNNNNSYQNIFESTVTIDQQSSSGYFMLGHRSSDQFLDDIIVTSSGSAGIYLGSTSPLGWTELAAGKTIKVGSSGFTLGFLYLKRFIQQGSTPINLTFTGPTAYLAISDTTVLNGDLITRTPGIFLNGGVFNGKVNAVKTGITNDQSQGGNIFRSDAALINSGRGNWQMGGVRADSFYAKSHFQSDSMSYIALAWNSLNNYFADDITVSSTYGSRGVFFTNNTNSSAILEAGHTINIGSAGFDTGTLSIKRFTQRGNTPINLLLTKTATLALGPLAYIGGDMVASSPSLLLNGAEFSGTTDLTKTGVLDDGGEGGNLFKGVSKIANAGSGYLLLGNINPDVWNDDVTLTSSGDERILVAWSKPGNMFNGNVYVNSTGTSGGIRFCGGSSAATATIAAGKSISTGTTGFTSGNLILKQVRQLGNAPNTLTFDPTATYIQYGPSSQFGGNVTSSSPGLYFHGAVFNGKVNATKTGGNSDYSNGSNTFNDEAVITNAGTAALLLAYYGPDTFNGPAAFNNTGSANFHVAYNGPGNTFNGTVALNNATTNNSALYVSQNTWNTSFNDDITITSTSGGGVQFCNNSGANATLSAGHVIKIGSAGFASGTLLLKQLTQAGSAAQNLTLTGTSTLIFGPLSNMGGAIVTSSPTININGCVFNGTASFTKTGTTNDNSSGGNTFRSATSFTNTGTGSFILAVTNQDVHAGSVSFVQPGSGRVYPNYNANVNYAGDISVTSLSGAAVSFGAGTGTATISGSSAQAISATAGSAVPVIARLVMNNTGSGLTLNANVNISKTLTLNAGLIYTSSANILTMLNTSATAAGTTSSTSYIAGPMRYQKSVSGPTVLNFPIGNSTEAHPLALTVTHTNGNLYTYQAETITSSAMALNYTLPFSVSRVSQRRYYTIQRFNSSMVNQPSADLSGNQAIEIFFGPSDFVTDGSMLTIVKNTTAAPASWIDIGGFGAPPYSGGTDLTGSVRSTSSPSAFNSFSTFALGNTTGGMNVLPVTLLGFQATPGNDGVMLDWATASENNNSHFTIERSHDAIAFQPLREVASKGINGNSGVRLDYTSLDAAPLPGVSYYRLKQTDLNGKFIYSKTVKVDLNTKSSLTAYPNPARNSISFSGLGYTPQQARVEWFDASGKNVLRSNLAVAGGKASMNMFLPDGMYMVKITLADGTSRVKQIMIKK